VRLSSIRPLGKTGLHYLTTTGFGVEFAKVIDEYTGERATARGMYLSAGVGIFKPIKLESGSTLSPFAGVANTYSWVTIEAEGLRNTNSDSAFSGQIGLSIGILPSIDLIGSVVFSFEESYMVYSVYLSFHPITSSNK